MSRFLAFQVLILFIGFSFFAPAAEEFSLSSLQRLSRAPAENIWDGSNADCLSSLNRFSETTKVAPEITRTTWGYKGLDGSVLIPAIYEDARRFCNGLAAVKLDGKWGFVNPIGQYRIAPQYLEAGDYTEGVAPVKLAGGWAYVDKDNNLHTLPSTMLVHAGSFRKGRAAVQVLDTAGQLPVGVIRRDFSFQAPPVYFAITYLSEMLATTEGRDKLKGVLNLATGQEVLPVSYDRIVEAGGPYIVMEKDSLYGVATADGRNVISAQFDSARISRPSDAFVWVSKNGRYGTVLADLKYGVLPDIVSNTRSWSNSRLAVHLAEDESWRFLDLSGKIISAPYKEVDDFSENFAAVANTFIVEGEQREKLWGYINTAGQLTVPLAYFHAEPFHNGVAKVCWSVAVIFPSLYGGSISPYAKANGFQIHAAEINGANQIVRDFGVEDVRDTYYFSSSLNERQGCACRKLFGH